MKKEISTEEKKVYGFRAEHYFDISYSIFRDPSLTTPKNNPENAPFKSLSPVMIMLATSQTMRQVSKEKYDAIAKEMADEVINGGYLTDDALLEHVHVSGKPLFDTPTGRIVNPGHSLEAAWFLMQEATYQNDEEMKKIALKITDFSMKRGLFDGGIIAFTDVEGNFSKKIKKLLTLTIASAIIFGSRVREVINGVWNSYRNGSEQGWRRCDYVRNYQNRRKTVQSFRR